MKKEDEASLRDLGVEPYLYKDYADWASKVFEQLKYRFSPEMESQFKKPYLKFDHVKSEREYAGPGGGGDGTRPFYPPFVPAPYTPPDLPGFDMPGYSPPGFYFPSPSPTMPGPGGFGSAGPSTPGPNFSPSAPSPHAPDPNKPNVKPHKTPCEKCTTFVFPLYHHIYRVEAVGGTIRRQYRSGDDLMAVEVCWLDDAGTVKAIAYYDIFEGWAVVERSTEKHSCCNCGVDVSALTIGYQSQQMSCGGSQGLTASGGGGVYKWTLSGGGSLSHSDGDTTVYTAPSSNANCTNNPTITLTDCCEATTTLKIAVNCTTPNAPAYRVDVQCEFENYCYKDSGYWMVAAAATCGRNKCDGTVYMVPSRSTFGCTCCYPNTTCSCPGDCPSYCLPPYSMCEAIYYSHCGGPLDQRTTDMKAAGCCPAALL